jgi:hypothetical protein
VKGYASKRIYIASALGHPDEVVEDTNKNEQSLIDQTNCVVNAIRDGQSPG